jgi:hypothetical protein
MLTRSGVARTLRRSIATVRRIEGTLLHPIRDARGVHLFPVAEVADLVRRQARGELNLFRLDSATPAPTPPRGSPQSGEVARLVLENANLRRQLAELIEGIDALVDA